MDRIEGCKFQVGDKVWSPMWGEGCVEDIVITSPARDYPITVCFGAKHATYTLCGKWYRDENVTLFHAGSYIVEAPEPKRPYHPKKGELVAVSRDGKEWVPRIFIRKDDVDEYIVSAFADASAPYSPYVFCEPAHKHFNIPEKDARC